MSQWDSYVPPWGGRGSPLGGMHKPVDKLWITYKKEENNKGKGRKYRPRNDDL